MPAIEASPRRHDREHLLLLGVFVITPHMRCNRPADVPSEKVTRGLLRSATDRSLTRSAVVVLDSLNAIKGYRYELWCLARGMATRYCMVHVDSPPALCRQWNQQRSGDAYGTAVFEDLAGRFERPDARNKWDSPLFTVRPELGAEHVAQQVEAVVAAAMQGPAAAAASAGAAPAGSSGAAAGGRLTPTCATTNPVLSCEIDSSRQCEFSGELPC
jgi:protein KTI12